MKALLFFALLPAPSAVIADEALDIAQRSLPFIQEKGLAWITDRQCASCHQVPAMLWTLNTASRLQLNVDPTIVPQHTPWAADWRHWNKTGAADGIDQVSAGNIDTMVFLLLGRDPSSTPLPAWTSEFIAQILKNQQPDGSWKPGGQLPLGKRPTRETTEVTTMWTLLALQFNPDHPSPTEAIQRATQFLSIAQPGQSTEWHALRLLSNPEDPNLRTALLKTQHPDGSWGWLTTGPGDAFGTGLALYALAKSNLPSSDLALQRAITFLKNTQRPNGSWPVPSTRTRDQNRVNATATYWGTAWAAIALLETQTH